VPLVDLRIDDPPRAAGARIDHCHMNAVIWEVSRRIAKDDRARHDVLRGHVMRDVHDRRIGIDP
jgi:hypothetical protein